MTEQLIRSLKDRLNHVNKDQGFNLKRNLNIALSAYTTIPHSATGFSPFVLLYGCEAITPYEIPFTRYALEELYQDGLSSHIKKMFEIHTGAFLSNRRYQLKMKETFDKKKVGLKDVDKFQTGELVWFNVQRRMPDMKYNKAKWIGPCKVVSVLDGGLFKLSYEVNGKFIKYNRIHPQLLKRFCGEPLLIAS